MSWWQVEAKVKELREVSAGDDSAAIKAKIEELQKEVMAIGQVRCCAPAVACRQACLELPTNFATALCTFLHNFLSLAELT